MWDYITSLNWSQFWYAYISIGFLVVVLSVLLLKMLKNKIKNFIIFLFVLVVILLILYTLFLGNIINFDVMKLIGLNDLSLKIQGVIGSITEWFRNVF